MKWVAKVSYREPGGKIHRKVRIYDLSYNQDGTARKIDRTRVIRDVVPQDCTTVSISIKKKG